MLNIYNMLSTLQFIKKMSVGFCGTKYYYDSKHLSKICFCEYTKILITKCFVVIYFILYRIVIICKKRLKANYTIC